MHAFVYTVLVEIVWEFVKQLQLQLFLYLTENTCDE